MTGSATGIGRSTVTRLCSEGAVAVVNYVGPRAPADEVVAEVADAGGRAVAIEADISKEEQVQAMFAQAASELGGPVDILVNNAGVEAPFLLVDMPLDEWNRVLGVNLTGAFLCARETARGLLAAAAPGVIVNMSSVHEVIPWERFGHYCASKGGMKLWAATIAKELAPARIRVVNVAPGAIATPINKDVLEDDVKRRAVEAEIPWGRFGKPEEIAAAVAWLASDEAAYVTGTTLFVDGGMTAYPGFI
ncbi:MAG: glucose 1-dehydrogenase [Thermoleophilaceae bacterium]|nr:glucose 1-dehydrogenase [Thermoleophilaceae bacterium]